MIASCGAGDADRADNGATRGDQAGGYLDIRIHPVGGRRTPPADLIVFDIEKRRTGKDPQLNTVLAEIPNASYEAESIDDDVTEAAGPETRIISITDAVSGAYTLHVLGTDDAAYHLELRGVDREMNPSIVHLLDIPIATGADHRYTIEYSSLPGSEIKVRRH